MFSSDVLLLPRASLPVDRATEGHASYLDLDGTFSVGVVEESHDVLSLLGYGAYLLVQDSFRYGEPLLRRGLAKSSGGGLMSVDSKACKSSVLLVLVSEEEVPLRSIHCTVP